MSLRKIPILGQEPPYIWKFEPHPDITAYEIAKLTPLLVLAGHPSSTIKQLGNIIKTLPEQLARHFTKVHPDGTPFKEEEE